jgi:mRNA interferase MazF
MTMRKGEVWQVRLASTPGHAQAGDRPAVILTEDALIPALPTLLIVPFTGSRGALRFPGTLLVQPDGRNGLTLPSVALVFQIRALDKRDFLRVLGTLDAQTLDQLFAEFDRLTGH